MRGKKAVRSPPFSNFSAYLVHSKKASIFSCSKVDSKLFNTHVGKETKWHDKNISINCSNGQFPAASVMSFAWWNTRVSASSWLLRDKQLMSDDISFDWQISSKPHNRTLSPSSTIRHCWDKNLIALSYCHWFPKMPSSWLMLLRSHRLFFSLLYCVSFLRMTSGFYSYMYQTQGLILKHCTPFHFLQLREDQIGAYCINVWLWTPVEKGQGPISSALFSGWVS